MDARKPSAVYWESTYRDPATGTLPSSIRQRELAHVKSLAATAKSGHVPRFRWAEAGPQNLGGRTRALAVDRTDSDIILAGSVSGGLWKSADGGETWRLTNAEFMSVTTLAQDPRPGHTAVWYAGGGEFFGPNLLDSRSVSPFFGNGIYKSTDNGDSWQPLAATLGGEETVFDHAFDFVHRLVVSPTTGTLVVGTNGYGVFRSADGGATFEQVLGGPQQHDWAEVQVASDGTFMVVLSSTAQGTLTTDPGVYVSTDDGATWTRRTPPSFPTSHRRSVAAIAPSNSEVAYILTLVAPGSGANAADNLRFFKINLATGAFENRSANLPRFSGNVVLGATIFTQFGYNMTLAVKPDDEDFILLGGTSLFRSRDGLATPLTNPSASIVGGYQLGGGVVAGHYVDQHGLFFDPNQPRRVWSGNDGGVFVNDAIDGGAVRWTPRNNGYNVTQFYTIAISPQAGDTRLIGGTQDYGMQYIRDLRAGGEANTPFSDATRITFGDGSSGYVGERFVYAAKENGQVRRLRYLNADQTEIELEGTAVQPTRATNLAFIQPMAVDPNNERLMYYPAGNVLWRCRNIEATVTTPFWDRLDNLTAPSGYRFTSLTVTQTPAHVLYLGASHPSLSPRVYRLDQSDTATSGLQEISIPDAARGARVHGLAVNPLDGNELVVVLSNYNIVSLYHSRDGGQTYTAIEGNLEGTVATPGPSVRSAAILPLTEVGGTETVYFVGTSAGLFMTTQLAGPQTLWQQIATERIGFSVVESLVARPSDGRLAVGTHGRGAFIGDIDLTSVATEASSTVPNGFALATNYPNPFRRTTQIPFTLAAASQVTLTVFDMQGRQVYHAPPATYASGSHEAAFEATDMPSGSYVYRLQVTPTRSPAQTYTLSRTMTVVR